MKTSGSIFGVNYDTTLSLNYIQVPALAKLNVPLGNTAIFAVSGGPYAGIAVSREVIRNATTGGTGATQQADVSDSYSQFDVGARFGAGVEVPFNDANMAVLLGANYDLGLLNIAKDGGDPVTNTRTFIASLGLGVHL